MPSQPTIVERVAQPYLAIGARVTIKDIPGLASKELPELFAWLGARGVQPSGPPFFKYNVIDMERELQIEVGVPTATPVAGDDRVRAGTLPAGRYATLIHQGHYNQLVAANAALLEWIRKSGLRSDVSTTPAGDRFGCRMEIYLTDPATEPNPELWQTEVTILLA
jgi:effector-binding domain-containing protein